MNAAVKYVSIDEFLSKNGITINDNPAISPNCTLDFPTMVKFVEQEIVNLRRLADPSYAGQIAKNIKTLTLWPKSHFAVESAHFFLIENSHNGDCAFVVVGQNKFPFEQVHSLGDLSVVPLTWKNLISLKNVVLTSDSESTIFPRADGDLSKRSLGVGARFTTLHWPAVAWAMKMLDLPLTANQNSIPRELVYDVNAMLEERLSQVPFPFIGRSVPEGHQGQSVQGMTHASIVTFLKYGFHQNRIPYAFNADHQPVGGRFDAIEKELVEGSLFASYITYDLSPELSESKIIDDKAVLETVFSKTVDHSLYSATLARLEKLGFKISAQTVKRLMTYLLPAMKKMKRRDDLYTKIRKENFVTKIGQQFNKELSIDELPGETAPETMAVCLAMAEAFGVQFNYVAPNIGFQKNFPYENNNELRSKIVALYDVAQRFSMSIGFHSGSGKSAENYSIIGEVTKKNFEIKTSGRYTYEMGKALFSSDNAIDRALWNDWYLFTRDLAIEGAFSQNEVQRSFARQFIIRSFDNVVSADELFSNSSTLRAALEKLTPSPEHMFWFEYNFLFVLAAQGSPQRLGDHTPLGYLQRKRFYSISDSGKLNYAKNVAGYILFLAETTGLVSKEVASNVRNVLVKYSSYDELLDAIGVQD